MSKHFIRLDTNNNIIKGFSTDFEQPIETDICINEDGERHFELNGEINPPLIDMQGRFNYKFSDGKVVKLTEEEKEKLFPTPKPTLTVEERMLLMQKAIDDLTLGGAL